ncbi:hypothetical protein Tco_0830196, partial [Tanacetum coccineum]
SASSS